ncbi:hypothetical protein EVY07_08960 [Enterobacter hormaechei]|uniref:hypothetical protein n=1 Tax=Enterobacter hormaechei TaxID=158836 RepID=UPI00101BAAAF|nr:hypothetical protein [Enterobacter hormaechei]RYH61309.1 hypothetical protein EVY07_08960 [Enterobacter hormaechei]
MDESRKQFEDWFNPRKIAMQKRGISTIRIVRLHKKMLEAWQASRGAIEIELPSGATKDDERLSCETSHEGSFNLCLHHASKAILAAGIKVKE